MSQVWEEGTPLMPFGLSEPDSKSFAAAYGAAHSGEGVVAWFADGANPTFVEVRLLPLAAWEQDRGMRDADWASQPSEQWLLTQDAAGVGVWNRRLD